MSYGKRPTVIAKDCIEDLSYRQEGAVDAALANRNESPNSVRCVADEHDRPLAPGVSDLTHRNARNVASGPQAREMRVATGQSSQPEAGDKGRRLDRGDTRESCEFLGVGSPEP